ncbi:hypothetical protein FNW07_12525 [Flavobacterium sp. GT3R68]|nr:hypothetical protein EKL32_20540 [Flavobacterium sp. GSN2]TRW89905.1 hypothetical protein FNW07_12525 [Flavobacterium sp. GT3R68]
MKWIIWYYWSTIFIDRPQYILIIFCIMNH